MQQMRDVLRTTLARSLSGLSDLDRLSAAWPIVAGHALATRASVVAFEEAVVTLRAQDELWRRQFLIEAARLRSDLTRVSGVRLTDILFITA